MIDGEDGKVFGMRKKYGREWVIWGVMGMVMSMGWGWLWMEKRVGFVFMVEEMRRLKVGELEKVGWVVGE